MTNRILNLKHGDEDGGNDEHLTNVVIDVVANGFLITAIYTDETESKFIARNLAELNDNINVLVKG